MRRMRMAAWFVLVMAGVGCGGGDVVPLSNLPARLSEAQCARVFRCCSLAQIQKLYGSSITDSATCVQALSRLGPLLISGITDAQNAGRIHYNGATADACFQKLGTAACTTASNDSTVVSECAAYLEPLVASGGACSGDLQCHTGFCDRPPASTADGTCRPLPTKGLACTSRCAAGSTCDTVKSICVEPEAVGAFCITDSDCLSGNCDNANLTGGKCAPAAATCGPSP